MTLDAVVIGAPIDVFDQAARERAGYYMRRSSCPLLRTSQLNWRRFIEVGAQVQVVWST